MISLPYLMGAQRYSSVQYIMNKGICTQKAASASSYRKGIQFSYFIREIALLHLIDVTVHSRMLKKNRISVPDDSGAEQKSNRLTKQKLEHPSRWRNLHQLQQSFVKHYEDCITKVVHAAFGAKYTCKKVYKFQVDD